MRLPTPTIPISTQSSGQFASPTVAPAQDFSGQQLQQVGLSLQKAGASASRIGQEVQADLDQGFLLEADAMASEEVRKFVGEYQQRAGLDAIEAFEDTHKGLKDRLRNLGNTARSPEQRQALDRRLAQRFQDASDRMATHRDRAIKDRAIGGAEAGRLAAVNDYLDSLGNPEDMALHRALAMDRTAELSRMRGEDGDAARLSMLDTTTRMHIGAAAALLQAGRAQEAETYLNEWKKRGEIGAEAFSRAQATTRAAVIEDMARNAFQAGDTFDERMKFIDEAEDLTPTEQEAARRHLRQFEQQQNANEALVANGVENELRQWMAEHPFNDPSDNPELFAKATRYNVRMERNPDTIVEFERQLESMPAESDRTEVLSLDKLQQMTDGQLLRFLGRGLSDFDRRRWFAFVRGDQDVVGRQDRIKRAAEVMGLVTEPGQIIDKSARAANAAALNTFEQHVDKQIKRLRIDKKRDLSNDEIQKEVLDPMIADKVTVDTWGPGVEVMPVYRAQVDGYLPVDDPNTPDDESLSVSSQDVYVDIDGKMEPLYQIPAQERRRLQLDWDKREQKRGSNRQMTAEDLMKGWIEAGRPGGPKRPEQPAPSPSPTSGMADPLRFGGR